MNKDNMYVGLRGGGRLGCNYSLKLEETEVIYKFLGPGLYHDLAFFFQKVSFQIIQNKDRYAFYLFSALPWSCIWNLDVQKGVGYKTLKKPEWLANRLKQGMYEFAKFVLTKSAKKCAKLLVFVSTYFFFQHDAIYDFELLKI